MAHAETATDVSGRLLELAGRLQRQEDFGQVMASLRAGHAATLDGVWGSSCVLVAAALAAGAPGPLVVVCPHVDDTDEMVDDLALFTRASAERRAMSSQMGCPEGARAEWGRASPSASPTTWPVAAVPRKWHPPPAEAQVRHANSQAASKHQNPK